MRLAEGVATGDQGDDFLIVHGHAIEGGADVLGRQQVVAAGIRTFRIHVDQAHVRGAEGSAEFALVADAFFRVDAQPLHLGAPVHVVVGFPDVFAAAGETEGAEAHRFQCDIAGEDEQVGPGNGLAVFLLDRPQQAPRLVDVDVVRPRVQRCETLLSAAAAATPIDGAIRARCVPGHAHHLRAVVAEVGRPPGLRIGHQAHQVGRQRLVVQRLEGFRIVEIAAERIGLVGVLVEQIHAQLVWPPVAIRRAAAGGVVIGAFRCVGRAHWLLLSARVGRGHASPVKRPRRNRLFGCFR